jgi:hypothetical protein
MALLTVTTLSAAGALTNLAAVNTTDTISASDIGDRGVILDVNNGAGAPITVTISDVGLTPAGNVGTPLVVTVTNATRKRIFVGPKNVNPATGVATLTYSSATTITAEAFRY